MRVLGESEWRARQSAHAERVEHWTRPHRQRKRQGEKHPVWDFLWTYYSFRPGRLERWHPGVGIALENGDEFLSRTGFVSTTEGVTIDPHALTAKRAETVDFVHGLLAATAQRPAKLGCFGLHEWAMAYRISPSEVRHAEWPLRLGHSGTDEVVESMRINCTHFDAFRFFAPEARPRNEQQLEREDQIRLEQPGCLHSNMDLYKWCAKLDPFVPAELTADCFDLALRVRELDMRASPYDLRDLGYEPVAIETPHGRAEYVRQQREFAAEAATLRQRIISTCENIRAWAKSSK